MCNLMQRTATATTQLADVLTVRPASLLDAGAIAEIYNQYVDGGPFTMEEDHWTYLSVKRQLDHFNDREGVVVCEDSDGEIVGWGKVRQYSDRGGYRIACEMSTYVRADTQGQGVGKTLLAEMIHLSRRLGYHHAVARVIAGNELSLRFHQRHGFELVGVQKEIGVVDGHLADVAILQRIDSAPIELATTA